MNARTVQVTPPMVTTHAVLDALQARGADVRRLECGRRVTVLDGRLVVAVAR